LQRSRALWTNTVFSTAAVDGFAQTARAFYDSSFGGPVRIVYNFPFVRRRYLSGEAGSNLERGSVRLGDATVTP